MSRPDDEETLRALEELSGDQQDAATDWSGAEGAASVGEGPEYRPEALPPPMPAAAPSYGPEYQPELEPEAYPEQRAEMAPALYNGIEGNSASPAAEGGKAPPAPAQPAHDAKAERLAALAAIADDGGDERIRQAFGRDKQQAQSAALIDAISAGVSGRVARPAQLPSEADLESTLVGRGDARRNALIKAMAERNGQGFDPSLAQRRLDLSEEARNRLQLSREQLEALKKYREGKGTVDQTKVGIDQGRLDETTRHNKAMEGRPVGKGGKAGGGGPAPKFKAGDLNSVPEVDRPSVLSLLEGRSGINQYPAKDRTRLMRAANAIDPAWDTTRFGSYKKVAEGQATDKSKLAIDVASHHLDEAERLIPDNFDTKALNQVRNAFFNNSGTDNLTAFQIAMLSSAHEIAKTLGVDDASGKAMIEHLFDPNQSKDQLKARIAEARHLMEGKTQGFARQRDLVAPTHFGEKPAAPPATHGAAPAGGMVRVRMKAGPNAGKTGSVPAEKFDPVKHEKLDG